MAATVLLVGSLVGISAGQTSPALDFLIVPTDVGFRTVDVIIDEVFDVAADSRVLTLVGGTAWQGTGILLPPSNEIVILPVPTDLRFAVAYSAGLSDVVRLVKGAPIARTALLVKVLDRTSGGRVLKLSNGDVVELGYDANRASTWRAPFDALILDDKIYNLKKGRSVSFHKL